MCSGGSLVSTLEFCKQPRWPPERISTYHWFCFFNFRRFFSTRPKLKSEIQYWRRLLKLMILKSSQNKATVPAFSSTPIHSPCWQFRRACLRVWLTRLLLQTPAPSNWQWRVQLARQSQDKRTLQQSHADTANNNLVVTIPKQQWREGLTFCCPVSPLLFPAQPHGFSSP